MQHTHTQIQIHRHIDTDTQRHNTHTDVHTHIHTRTLSPEPDPSCVTPAQTRDLTAVPPQRSGLKIKANCSLEGVPSRRGSCGREQGSVAAPWALTEGRGSLQCPRLTPRQNGSTHAGGSRWRGPRSRASTLPLPQPLPPWAPLTQPCGGKCTLERLGFLLLILITA